jgi:peroxiredoxin Q/BCP
MSGLKEGDKAPIFKLPDQDGKMVDMAERIGKQPLVIYFYPKDFTSGCTMEAHAFREMYEAFQKEGADVFGISSDGIESHKKFVVEHELPFTLLSDENNRVREMLGAFGIGHTPGRVTYVVDKKGMIRMVFSSQLQPRKHIDESIKRVREIAIEP